MDDQNQDSAQDRNAKNTSEQSAVKSESSSSHHNIIINIEDSKYKNNEGIPEKKSALKKEVNACSDKNTSLINDNVIINIQDSKHKNNEDMSVEIPTCKKEVHAYIKQNTSLNNDVIVNIEESKHNNNEEIHEGKLSLKKCVNENSDNNTSLNNDVKDSKYTIIEDISEKNVASEKVACTYNTIYFNNDLVINIEDKGIVMFKNKEDTLKEISAYKKEEYRGINTALLEVFNYNMGFGGSGSDVDDGAPLDYTPDRNSFILKVFAITLIMLLATAAFVLLVIFSATVNHFCRKYYIFMMITGSVILIAINYGMMCSTCCTRAPVVIFVLILLVFGFCLILGPLSAVVKTQIIAKAFVITCVIVIICMILACTRFDFTSWLLYVIVIGAVLSVIGLGVTIAYFSGVKGKEMTIVRLVILVVMALVQTVMLVIELQMILGGKAVELSENQACFGAYMLYFSIVDLFIKMIQILNILEHL